MMDWIYSAGDVNSDGFDDFFYLTFSQPYGYCGLIDGATLTVVWQRYDNYVYGILDFISGEPADRPDLDGDGVADFLFGQPLFNGLQFGHRVTAVSGLDGMTIWERQGPEYPVFRQACGRDLDGDGVADLTLIMEEPTGGSLQAWSGADGHTFWIQSTRTVDSFFPPGWFSRGFGWALMTRGVGSSAEEVVVLATYNYSGTSPEYLLVHFDGATGGLLETVELPETLAPWSDEPVLTWPYDLQLMPAGDVDRDGFQEYAVIADDPDANPPWANPGATQQIAILGQRNLNLPTSARGGASVLCDLHVPSAAGRNYLLLASTGFAPEGGFVLEGWQTNLEPQDPVFQTLWTTRFLRGALDAQGRATPILRIPAQAWLIGKRLHFRALIGDPALGEVWTLSSLATLEVLP